MATRSFMGVRLEFSSLGFLSDLKPEMCLRHLLRLSVSYITFTFNTLSAGLRGKDVEIVKRKTVQVEKYPRLSWTELELLLKSVR